MRGFFSLDGAFNKYGSYIADTLILSVIWIIFSIPIITIGASTTAMFYVSTRRIADREGYITSDFWSSFKSNFGKATKLWLIILGLVLLLVFNIQNLQGLEMTGVSGGIVVYGQYALLLLIALISVFIFPITARFHMSMMQIIKSSFYMSLRHFLTSLICVLMFLGLLVTIFEILPVILFAAPGLYAMAASYLIMRIIRKYRPEIDPDPVAELQEIEAQKTEERRLRGISTIEFNDDTDDIEK